MSKIRFHKVRILKCSNPDFWYADKVGIIIKVREFSWLSAYVECSSGDTVLRADLDIE